MTVLEIKLEIFDDNQRIAVRGELPKRWQKN